MAVVNRVVPMSRDVDYRQAIIDEVSPFLEKTGIRTFGADVLIAVFSRAGFKTAGGIVVPMGYQEDRYQGITGLILSMGPMCCEEKSPGYLDWFGDRPPKVGDWIGFSVRDGISVLLGERPVRFIEWKYLRFPTNVPDLVM